MKNGNPPEQPTARRPLVLVERPTTADRTTPSSANHHVPADHGAAATFGLSVTTMMSVAIGPRSSETKNHAIRLRPFD